ncbi:MAG TPA: hypothetical protein PLH92_14940 [Mycobacterium sp.]|uniref:hypothetical protein n=1 Tax=Mycolicibacterium sp. TaxID=2320850 RepID=UPI0026013CDA|nr:hypothetical protein [Mycolicibacterium sp.]HPX36409.1 hypothetical protein [Mycobacterium sp.]HQC78004.1 hypothetical protein [Mycobacterium sp.]
MAARIFGLVLAVTGLAHFVKPASFQGLTETAFPTNARRHTYINGGIETALGLGLVAPKTRKLAVAGLLGYAGYLGASLVRNR